MRKAMRASGCRVIYFAGYRNGEDLFHHGDVEDSADQVIWSADTGADIHPAREQDRFIRGNILEAMVSYAKGELGQQLVPLSEARRLIRRTTRLGRGASGCVGQAGAASSTWLLAEPR